MELANAIQYTSLYKKILEWPRDAAAGNGFQGAHTDEIQIVLMCLVLLFSSDLADLDRPDQVSDVQAKYATMLHRYLKTKYRGRNRHGTPLALAKFATAMTIGSVSRELRDLKHGNNSHANKQHTGTATVY